jgi:glutamyl/glutaminyl-tRNA synthetase
MIGATSGWRTRFAPAPTGWLHLGHVLNAITIWGMARAFRGTVVLRIEDHDRRRCKPEYEDAIREDLAWLGFTPDEEAPRQSARESRYADVLHDLEQRALAYPCACSRRDIASGATERHLELVYPGTCRTKGVGPAKTPARRVRLSGEEQRFDDLRSGVQAQVPAMQCGDLLVRDRDGQWTYQFAVTVDDMDQGIDLVIRGEDLLPSTGRQLQLAGLIGRTQPIRFLHHALLRHGDGEKLSKSRGDTGVRELREVGATPDEVIGAAAHAGGLIPAPLRMDVDAVAALFATGAFGTAAPQ